MGKACAYAGISVDTFYRHQRDDPEFARTIHDAQQWAGIIARHSLLQSIKKGNGELALKFLKAREPELYAPDNSTTVNVLATLSLEEITQRRRQLNSEIASIRAGGLPPGGGGEEETLALEPPDPAYTGAPEATGTHEKQQENPSDDRGESGG